MADSLSAVSLNVIVELLITKYTKKEKHNIASHLIKYVSKLSSIANNFKSVTQKGK